MNSRNSTILQTFELAHQLAQEGNFAEAKALCQQILDSHPNEITILIFLATLYDETGHFAEAIVLYEKALALQSTTIPNSPEQSTPFNPGNAFTAASHYNTLGNQLCWERQVKEAILHYRKAIEILPNYAEAHWNLAYALLLTGNLHEGFAEYEWRWQIPEFAPATFPRPLWDGNFLDGQTIFLSAEQGYGDCIQFLRYLPFVKAKGGRIILGCHESLRRLLIHLPEIETVVVLGQPLPEFQVWAPLMSLPYLFGTTLETVPVNIPYLTVSSKPPITLSADSPLKIGIVWAGSPANKNDHNRSCELTYFLDLAHSSELTVYSLQKVLSATDSALLKNSSIQDLSSVLNDFADTATIIAQLDLIIAVDTAVVHLAGALGKPVWVLLSYFADWRWMLEREDSPWYPTVRLFRQPKAGDWHSVFQQVKTALNTYCKPGSSVPLTQAFQALKSGNLTTAETLYQQVLQQSPQNFEAVHALGIIACQNQQFSPAISYFRQAEKLRPGDAVVKSNLGFALQQQGNIPKAIEAYQAAIKLNPNYTQAYYNLAALFHSLADVESALRYWQKTLELAPQNAEFHLGYAHSLLLSGDLKQGFAEYEWRWQTPGFSPRICPQPRWEGWQLNGQILLIDTEQGFGDILQFIRYGFLVKERGGRMIVRCSQPLKRLLRAMNIFEKVIDFEAELPEFHTWIPLMSLPHVLETTLASIPHQVPYLKVPEPSSLSPQISADSALKIGIVWASLSEHPSSQERSFSINYFLPLLEIPGLTFWSLQKEVPATDLEVLNNSPIQDLREHLTDFADTATLISQFDLIISADTAVAHLAGALGKPVWVLLPFVADWRWLLKREDSPWYPTMRLFRQPKPGDWQSVFDQVKTALNQQIHSTQKPILPAPASPANKLGITWRLSSTSGWGIYGINLALQLLRNPDWEPMLIVPATADATLYHPLAAALLQPLLEKQQSFQQLLESNSGRQIFCKFPLLHALGNQGVVSPFPEQINSDKKVGIIFFEDTYFPKSALENLKTYPLIIAGSAWNVKVLESYGLKNVQLAHQGIDPTIFHPAPSSNLFKDRFVIFSGGKLEYRKGQDIVIAAFKQFQKRHPEALLLTAWHTFWPQFMQGIEETGHVKGLPKVNAKGRLELAEWLVNNDVPNHAFIDLGILPNYLMGQILREADVAVFTSRCEGGTNLVAMESLACGIPTIISANTGHLDLLNSPHCYPLNHQKAVKGSPHFQNYESWGESDLEELLETLELLYSQRPKIPNHAATNFLQNWNWETQIKHLTPLIQKLLTQ